MNEFEARLLGYFQASKSLLKSGENELDRENVEENRERILRAMASMEGDEVVLSKGMVKALMQAVYARQPE